MVLISILFFKDEPIYQFPDDAQQKHYYGNGIYGVHYLQVKTGWPVRVLFSEKVHKQNYINY